MKATILFMLNLVIVLETTQFSNWQMPNIEVISTFMEITRVQVISYILKIGEMELIPHINLVEVV